MLQMIIIVQSKQTGQVSLLIGQCRGVSSGQRDPERERERERGCFMLVYLPFDTHRLEGLIMLKFTRSELNM